VDEAALAEVLARAYGRPVTVHGLRRDSGGASRITTSFEAVADGAHPLILRQAGPGQGAGIGLGLEAELMRAAIAEGVPTPALVAAGADYVVMARVEGETIPRRILRDPPPGLAVQCGEILAAIHRIPPVPGLTGGDQLELWRAVLDATGEPHPALELALRRLELERPASSGTTVVHGDFRNGNLIIGPEGVRAVLDWELAHLGDPIEDLGWLCAKPWRFGSPLPVGGFGERAELVAAYEAASGRAVDPDALRWWELFGVLKWAIVCIMQAQRHLSGGERSVELAALGRRVAESEWDLLTALGAGAPKG
jgi:aminoglycoside phosphotransferase (APT) family kinase protein